MAKDLTPNVYDPAAAQPEPPLESESGGRWFFRALRHRNYRLFFTGQLISLIGTWMQSVAQAWLVLKLTNSSMMLGVVSFANYLPILLVALFAGVVIDHVDRRRLLMISQSLLMLSAFILAGLTWFGVVRVEHVIILAAFNGVVSSFDMPARQAFVADMVGIEDLPNAIAINSMMVNGARTVGPAVAGLLIALVGTALCFFLNGVSYLAVIWCLFEMELPRRSIQRFGSAMWQRLREGLGYTWRERPVFYLLLLIAVHAGIAIQYTVLIPVFARDILHGGAWTYGLLMAGQGAGAVLGAASLATRSGSPRSLRQNLTIGLFCAAAGIIVFGFSQSLVLSLIAQVVSGAGRTNYQASTNTILQLYVSDELRGRLMSVFTVAINGITPFGSLGVGFMGETISPEAAVVSCGTIAFCCGLFLLTRLKLIAQAQAEITPQPRAV
jgi:MFS family permease